ncbi:MAG: hypothetical protein H7Z37_12715, partial [Pyrinomonadaceae bacterium]|nr:hypothetical protein [Pyrinomonadaceae bacterium]
MLNLKLYLMTFCAATAFGCALQSNNGSVEASGKETKSAAIEKVGENTDSKKSASAKTAIVNGVPFRGVLSGKTIEMNLKRDGNALSGTYLYSKIRKNLTLRGTIDAENKFDLQEFDEANRQTGVFKGEWKTDPNEAGITLVGTWHKPNAPTKENGLFFTLSEQMINFSNDEKIVTRIINNDLKAKRLELTAEYPEITNASSSGIKGFNQTAKNLAQKD